DGATGNRRLLVSGANQQLRDPRWSPDGQWLAYLSAPRIEGRAFDVYIISIDGGPPRRITSQAENMSALVWLPDGSRLLYTTGFNGPFRIPSVNVDGTGGVTFPPPVGAAYGDPRTPLPSPDSSRVAFFQTAD